MLTICSDHHQEICFDGWDCPLCEIKSRERTLEDRIDDLRGEVSMLEDENCELEQEVMELKKEVKSCRK